MVVGLLPTGLFSLTVSAAATPLPAPTNPRWDGQSAKWDPVTEATQFQVDIYKDGALIVSKMVDDHGEQMFDFDAPHYYFKRDIEAGGKGFYTFAVKAIPDPTDTEHTSSPFSALSERYVYGVDPEVIPYAHATVTVPVATAHPDMAPIAIYDEKYKVTVSFWDDSATNTKMNASDTFMGGKNYRVELRFTPKSGFVFNDDTTVTINGRTPVCTGYYSDGSRAYLVDFTALGTLVPAINITGLDKPIANQPADFTADETIAYTVSNIAWKDSDAGRNVLAGQPVTGGHNLNCSFRVVPRAGFMFTADTTVNIGILGCSNLTTKLAADGYLIVRFSVLVDYLCVKDFNIISLTPPADGVTADYTALVTNSGFSVTEVYYAISGINVNPYTGKAGDKHSIGIIISAADGYSFASDSPLTATCAGLTFKTAVKSASMADNERRFVFEYTVPTTATTPTTKPTTPTTKPTTPTTKPTTKILYGDADDNGKVNIADLLIIKKDVVKIKVNINRTNADVNFDEKCNLSDMLMIKKHIVGIKIAPWD